MKLKYKFELVDMGEDFIAVPIGENASNLSGVVRLNKSGAEVFTLLREEISESEIVKKIEGKYEDTPEVISHYIATLIATLRSDGLIEE